jgi:hypothetical protein
MNLDGMTIEQHLSVLYLLDVTQGEGISEVEVDGFSGLPDGPLLLRLAQTQTSRQRTKLAYEIARDGSRQQLGRDPLDPLRALEPILDAVAPNQELETESGEPPLAAQAPPRVVARLLEGVPG